MSTGNHRRYSVKVQPEHLSIVSDSPSLPAHFKTGKVDGQKKIYEQKKKQ